MLARPSLGIRRQSRGAHRSLHGARKAREAHLRDVIDGTALQRENGEVLADRSRHEDERRITAHLPHNSLCREAIEVREIQIAQDHVGDEGEQPGAQLLFVAHGHRFHIQLGTTQRHQAQFSVVWAIVNEENVDRSVDPRRLRRSQHVTEPERFA